MNDGPDCVPVYSYVRGIRGSGNDRLVRSQDTNIVNRIRKSGIDVRNQPG